MMKPIQRKRRISQRGAALVETALMFPLFITITFAGFYAYNLGRAAIEVKTASRQEAWTYAMSNCGQNGASETETLPAQAPPTSGISGGGLASKTSITHDPNASFSSQLHAAGGGVGAVATTIMGQFFNLVQGLFPNPNGSTNTQHEAVNYRIPSYGSPNAPGYVNRTAEASSGSSGLSKNVTNSVTVFCNEPAHTGNKQLGAVNAVAAALQAVVVGLEPSYD